jgi:hypothetical protein
LTNVCGSDTVMTMITTTTRLMNLAIMIPNEAPTKMSWDGAAEYIIGECSTCVKFIPRFG